MILVVAALLEENGKILIARRKEGHLSGFWEFPGGKIEQGETSEEALERELAEELGLETRTGSFFMETFYDYKDKAVRLLVYRSEVTGGDLCLSAHSEVLWVTPKEMGDYVFAPADVAVVNKLVKKI